MGLLHDHTALTAAVSLLGIWLVTTLFSFVQSRRKFSKLPGPPFSMLLGHLVSVGKVAMKLPKRAHPHLIMTELIREYNLPGVFYIDTRPISSLLTMVVADPEAAREVSEAGLAKHPSVLHIIEPIAGKRNMFTSEGNQWRKWRSVFNPIFSIQQVVSQVPTIVGCSETFINNLDRYASANEVFRLEEETTKITIDVIGLVVLDHDFKSLTTDNEYLETMRKTLAWMPDTRYESFNPLHHHHPLRPIMWKYYKWQMDKYIGKVLDDRFAVRSSNAPKKAKKKIGIDLALEAYFKENGQDVDSQNATMDAEFRKFAIDNLLMLMFAGHDTTASTLCYCYHLLQKHPEKLAKARLELDEIFGAGVSANEQLRAEPYMINRCEYTLAIIKEALRLWPPASAVRHGTKDFFITDPVTGEKLPTDGMNVWVISICMGRSVKLWGPDVDDFKPERFLPENADKLPPNAYRPFEKGPRNCIGQELALIEMKVLLALTLREFDIRAAFNELETLSNDGSLWAKDHSFRGGPQQVFGDEMYQILLAAGKPREGMPSRVTRRDMSV